MRPYFRIDADNKENRFQRALQFYRKNRNVMRALEDFIVARHNATGATHRRRALLEPPPLLPRARRARRALRAAAASPRTPASRSTTGTGRRSRAARSAAGARRRQRHEPEPRRQGRRERSPARSGHARRTTTRSSTHEPARSTDLAHVRGRSLLLVAEEARARRAPRARSHRRAARDPRVHVEPHRVRRRVARRRWLSRSGSRLRRPASAALSARASELGGVVGGPRDGRLGPRALARLPGAPRGVGLRGDGRVRRAQRSPRGLQREQAHAGDRDRARAQPVRRALRHRRVAPQASRAEEGAPARGRERLGALLPDPRPGHLLRVGHREGAWRLAQAAVRALVASPQLVPNERDAASREPAAARRLDALPGHDADARDASRRSGSRGTARGRTRSSPPSACTR